MKKIGLLHFFAPLRFGGGETFLINFLGASVPSFDNKLVLFSASPEFSKELFDLGDIVMVTEFLDMDMGSGTKSSYLKLFFQIFLHPFRMRSVLKKSGDYDFIIGHGFPFNFILPFLRGIGFIKRDKKIVYFQHHRLMHSSGSVFQRMLYRKLFSRFDIIIANTLDVKNDILALDKKFSSKIIIYNVGLDFEYIKERSKNNGSNSVPIPANRVVGIYPARFMPHKNHRLFKKIFSALAKEGAMDRLFIIFSASGNDLEKAFQEEIMDEGYAKNCYFPKNLDHDDLLRAMSSSNLCIFPSLEEGFGLGILESLILGIPVVVLKEAIPVDLAAFTVTVDTEEEFVARSCQLIVDSKMLALASVSSREQYGALRKRFDLRETSVGLKDALTAMIGSGSA